MTLIQDAAHVDVLMHHQGISAHIVGLHDPVQHAMDPVEVTEEIDGTRHRGGKVQQEMREHDHVGVHPDDGPRGLDIRLQQPCIQ